LPDLTKETQEILKESIKKKKETTPLGKMTKVDAYGVANSMLILEESW
jgi:hypothetical protein